MTKSLLSLNRRNIKILMLIFVLLLLVAIITDYFQPIKEFLDNETYGIKIGTHSITIYKVLETIFVTITIFWFAVFVSDFGEKRIHKLSHIKGSTKSLITKIYQIFIYIFAALIGLEVLGIDLKALTVLSGAIGIGVGFGLQKIAANFISGLILLLEKSVEINDIIELPNGEFGHIKRTTARYTLVEAFDGKEVMIPNENFIVNQVINWTHSNNKARIEIPFSVDYNSDLELVQKLVLETAKSHPQCLKDPAPTCFLREFGASSVNFLLYFWVGDIADGRMQPQSEVMIEMWKKFKENRIIIPYPHQVIEMIK